MKLVFDAAQIPPPKRKTKSTLFDDHEPYLQLRHMILERRLKPSQPAGIFFGPEDQQKLEMKAPWRIAGLRLKQLVKSIGAQADYKITVYQTDTPGVWFVKVTYNPSGRRARG